MGAPYFRASWEEPAPVLPEEVLPKSVELGVVPAFRASWEEPSPRRKGAPSFRGVVPSKGFARFGGSTVLWG